MVQVSSKLLASIAIVLTSLLAFLAAYTQDVKVSVGPEPAFSAVSSLTSPQDWNFVPFLSEPKGFAAGTSTVYSLKILATTTPIAFSCKGFGMTFAQEYEMAVGNTPNATSTQTLGKLYVPANNWGTSYATTTATILSPGQFVNVKMATTSGTTVSSLLAPVGRCELFGHQL